MESLLLVNYLYPTMLIQNLINQKLIENLVFKVILFVYLLVMNFELVIMLFQSGTDFECCVYQVGLGFD